MVPVIREPSSVAHTLLIDASLLGALPLATTEPQEKTRARSKCRSSFISASFARATGSARTSGRSVRR